MYITISMSLPWGCDRGVTPVMPISQMRELRPSECDRSQHLGRAADGAEPSRRPRHRLKSQTDAGLWARLCPALRHFTCGPFRVASDQGNPSRRTRVHAPGEAGVRETSDWGPGLPPNPVWIPGPGEEATSRPNSLSPCPGAGDPATAPCRPCEDTAGCC